MLRGSSISRCSCRVDGSRGIATFYPRVFATVFNAVESALSSWGKRPIFYLRGTGISSHGVASWVIDTFEFVTDGSSVDFNIVSVEICESVTRLVTARKFRSIILEIRAYISSDRSRFVSVSRRSFVRISSSIGWKKERARVTPAN